MLVSARRPKGLATGTTRPLALLTIRKTKKNRTMLQQHLQCLEADGYCVVGDIIPEGKIDEVRDSIVQAQASRDSSAEAGLAATRSRGHRIGTQGVGILKQVINETQSFVPYLADRRILDIVDALFGPHARISCTDCSLNHPGNQRGYLHADWPFNATNAAHLTAPYPDATIHLSTIWMLSPFNSETGGTIVVPKSHRKPNNPAARDMTDVDCDSAYPGETNVTGRAGSVLVMDSRLWHAIAPNRSDRPRVALIIRYAPWWLNLNPTLVGTPEHTSMVVETGGKDYERDLVRTDVYESLPEEVKPLYRHCVSRQ